MWSRNSNGSVFRRDSIKSYVSYDSAFSIFNEHNSIKYENTEYNGLKKKTGFNNLRIAAGADENQITSISRSSSKSIRYSVLCALTELPFHELARLSKQSSADVADSSIFHRHARVPLELPTRNHSILLRILDQVVILLLYQESVVLH